ncbi:S8 family serine peptidase [Patescibacteria group bacterium]|nr:S8 family serine peptidase [Patescibacteria group bacterium]
MKKLFRIYLPVLAVLIVIFLLVQNVSYAESNNQMTIEGEYEQGTLLVKFHSSINEAIDISSQKINLPTVNHLSVKHNLGSIKPLYKKEGSDQVYKLTFNSEKEMEELLTDFQNNVIVEYAEPNYIAKAQVFTPDDPFYDEQWNFDIINVSQAWDYDTVSPKYGGDESIVVAVLDTGVAYEDRGSYVQATDLAETNFIDGYDFINDDAYPNDDNGHGTHIAGTIAQSTNNSLGVAGIAFNTSIMPIKVLNSNGDGEMSVIAQGVNFAVENGAHIINLSLGGASASITLETEIQAAQDAGVVIVAATGNDGISSVLYPAKYDEVIAVGATGASDEIADYSNRGTGIDLVAPGGNGSSGILQQTCATEGDCTSMGYIYYTGTSMATPHVSAAAALLLAYGVDPENIRDVLQDSAEDLGIAGYDTTFGYGRLDIGAAFQLVVGDTVPPSNPEISGYNTDGKDTLLTSGERYDYLTPYFEWAGAVDDISGIAGYHVYFGTDEGADPELEGEFVTDSFYTASSLSGQDDITYYLRIKTEDTEGNVTSSVEQFIYIIDTKPDYIVVGPSPGGGPQVRVFEHDGTLVSQFFAYGESFRGGVNVAVGDLDGDGVGEIVTGAGIGGGPQVRVFDYEGTPKLTNGFFAYAEHVRNGVYVAVGDLNGDGYGEIITGTGAGSGPHVRTFDRFGKAVFSPGFFAYAEHVRNGVYVATGDLNGNGRDEIITGTGQGSGPHVRTFNYIGKEIFTPGFFPYDSAFRGGVRVGTGDLDGNGRHEILTVPGVGGGPQVRVFDRFGDPKVTNGFFAFGTDFRGGTFLAGGDTNQDGLDEIIVGVGSEGVPMIRVFDQTGETIESQFYGLPETFLNGIIIASGVVK